MNKNEFLQKLKEDLSSLTEEEMTNALKYYEEYFADAGTEQDDAVLTEFVSPENVADKIKEEMQNKTKEKDNKDENENVLKIDFNNYTYENLSEVYGDSNNNNGTSDTIGDNSNKNNNGGGNHDKTYKSYNNTNNNTLKIVLLLCTAPFWLPIIIALASAAFGLFMGLLGVSIGIASIAVAGFAMIGAGFFSVGYGIMQLFTDFFSAFYSIGAGLVSAGLGILIAYLFTKLSVFVFKSQFKFAGFVIRGITGRFSASASVSKQGA